MSIVRDCVSELRPLTGPLFIPRWQRSMETYSEIILIEENRRTWRKIFLSATLFNTSPTWIDQGSNSGLRRERLATNRLNHGTATDDVVEKSLNVWLVWILFAHLARICSWLTLDRRCAFVRYNARPVSVLANFYEVTANLLRFYWDLLSKWSWNSP